ncbi:MAG: hypothetical protein HRU06_14085 [Oceanospirillaceae bacterium]|nr:hypothetical protein [Oceanospirillaceae bacterium]
MEHCYKQCYWPQGGKVKESDLYTPVKNFFQALGYEVKGEVKDCDLLAVKADYPPLIVELKLTFSLELVLQGVNRQALSDDVYLAIAVGETAAKRRNWRNRQSACQKLCRRLGLGLLLVQANAEDQQVQIILDPAQYSPRKNKGRQTKLLKEFNSRVGDPNMGGVNKTKIVTAYRQAALKCAQLLLKKDAMSVKEIREQAAVTNAAAILQKNYYGWFERVARGVYCLTVKGHNEMQLTVSKPRSLSD